ncbi:ATP-dependent dethiobiotin synthetase BioD [uncultured Desulfobacterium sp.]|uniref:ATP-dependent dethiobiotin synthetase BioD n=1 Tax=uncultured Desulfobacterium sp. TaxID=201089 RepID=A0A445MU76_9BACT|nr:ATP-dependent dethiobiotin synthetase BioD [uncultured Desulfobacterium sp.]
MNNQSDRFFITGTDTGVGKTVLSLLIMQYFYYKGLSPFYMKPFQTGCNDPYDTDSDARFIYSNIAQLKGKDPAQSVLYCFKNPKAPYFAARDEGREREIKTEQVIQALAARAKDFSPIILEGAGGLFVPVDQRTLMIDLIERTESRPIIAARAGLGTINHTLLTIKVLRERGIEPTGIIFLDPGDRPTPPDMISENMESIKIFSGIQVAGVIGKIENFSMPQEKYYDIINKIFETF